MNDRNSKCFISTLTAKVNQSALSINVVHQHQLLYSLFSLLT